VSTAHARTPRPADYGGSSCRLRRDRGVPPPGDASNRLVALPKQEELIKGLFQHRCKEADDLGCRPLGRTWDNVVPEYRLGSGRITSPHDKKPEPIARLGQSRV